MTLNPHRGFFTEGRWRKRPIAEVLALNAHINRHPSVLLLSRFPGCLWKLYTRMPFNMGTKGEDLRLRPKMRPLEAKWPHDARRILERNKPRAFLGDLSS